MVSGGSRISQAGAPTPRGGHQPIIWQKFTKTRINSSRMRTVRCGNRHWGVGGGDICLRGVCSRGVSLGCVCVCVCVFTSQPPPPVDRILYTRLWKHYLSETSFVHGKNCIKMNEIGPRGEAHPWHPIPPLGSANGQVTQGRIQDSPKEGAPTFRGEGTNIWFCQIFRKIEWNWENLGL